MDAGAFLQVRSSILLTAARPGSTLGSGPGSSVRLGSGVLVGSEVTLGAGSEVALVLGAVWWLDRYTPQPRLSLVSAFAWGAIGSVLLSLFFGTFFAAWISPQEETELIDSFLGATVQAPVIEETMKSAGLFALLIWGRRFISGPLDGVVYAALIAGGFAFTENILYFGNSFHQAQAAGTVDVFWQTFFLRGILSPFAHVSFTALCGLGLGIAAERRSLMLYFGLGLGGRLAPEIRDGEEVAPRHADLHGAALLGGRPGTR